jgi:cyclic dehypoxanthinyl futalosine synthase
VGLTKQEAVDMLQSDDLVGVGMAAHQMRLKKNDPRVVTYQIDRNINYTNFCTEYCSFCAFYRPLGAKDGYILSFETIYEKIEEMLELGGTGILLQGGLHPDLQIGYYENLLRSLKARFPQVHLHCFSAPEILCIAEVSELSVRETIQRLMDAGLQSIPGGGAEILDDEIRGKIARLKCTSDDWEEVHRVAHSLGLRTTATMMFGCGEELRHRVNHLERLRRIQEDTGGFTAFIPWMFAAENTALGKKVQETTAVDYLKTLAVSPRYKGLPGRLAVRGGRCRQHPHRRKRRVCRRREKPHQRKRASPDHFRCGICSRAAGHSLSLVRTEIIPENPAAISVVLWA